MNFFRKNKILLIAVFQIALFFPALQKTVHAFQQEHEICSEFHTHFHKKETDCSICDFHFSTFNCTLPSFKTEISASDFQKNTTRYSGLKSGINTPGFFTRGPPSTF